MNWFCRHCFEWQLYPSLGLQWVKLEDTRWLIVGPLQMRWRV